jgi:predicted RNA methylase
VTFSPQAIAELKRKLQAYGKDVYAKKNLAYQHFEVGGQVLIEGEHVERTRLRKGWIEELDLRGKTVLDLGCNLGVFALEAAKAGAATATGIDVQESVIKAGRLIRDFFGLANCELETVDLTDREAMASVEPRDIVFAFAVYDHFTGRKRHTAPWERENDYLEVTQWLARITGERLIAEFHNKNTQWSDFYRALLEEHGFVVDRELVTHVERPVFFCHRSELGHDEVLIDGHRFRRIRSWRKRQRMMYLLEKDGQRYICKRYGIIDRDLNRHTWQEFELLREFRDFPEVIQPFCHDHNKIVLPYFEGSPIQVIDGQPLDTARINSPALRFKLLSKVNEVLSAYFDRRQALFAKWEKEIPEKYREQVRRGERVLVDLCQSNILVSEAGEIRFCDFEPSKPPLVETLAEDMVRLLGPDRKKGLLARLLGR